MEIYGNAAENIIVLFKVLININIKKLKLFIYILF